MDLKLSGNHFIPLAAHHSYVIVTCPCCFLEREARKDVVNKKQRAQEELLCKSCAMKARPVTWKKDPSDLRKNQGAYKSYVRAKRRVKDNHGNAYGHVQFLFKTYEQFLEELGPRPEGMTLDRIDPMGDYAPGNVRWATIKQQARNRNPRYTWTPKPSNAVDAAQSK